MTVKLCQRLVAARSCSHTLTHLRYVNALRPQRDRWHLLVIPEAERRWRRDEDEEPVEDSYDRFGS